MSIFSELTELCRQTKVVKLAHPDDVIEEIAVRDEEGRKIKSRLGIRPGARTQDVTVRALSMGEQQRAEAIMDTAVPPALFDEEPSDKPGVPPRRVQNGYDDEHPEYLANLRKAQDKQNLFVVLKGVEGLESETEGVDEEAKMQSLLAKMDGRLIRYLSNEIWRMSYAGGDPNDFFTKEDSTAGPSSEPSQKNG